MLASVVITVVGALIVLATASGSKEFGRSIIIVIGGVLIANGVASIEREKFSLSELSEGTEYQVLWCNEGTDVCLLGEYRGTTEGTLGKFYKPRENEKEHMVAGKIIKKTTTPAKARIAVVP